MTSYVTPTDEQVDRVIPLLASPGHERYFFSQLNNPKWIGPLAKRGVFKYPPGEVETEDGRVWYPEWPPSRYLARVASQAPTEVAEIFAGIDTDNPLVIGDMVKAALAMPAGVATRRERRHAVDLLQGRHRPLRPISGTGRGRKRNATG